MKIFNLFKKTKFMDWNEYSNRIKAIDGIRFVQKTREQTIINMPACGGN